MATEIVSTIGTDPSRDYVDPPAWEADTDVDLVALDERHIGEMYPDSDYDGADSLALRGAIVDEPNGVYRHLRAAPGHRHAGVPSGGAKVRYVLTNHPGGTINLAEEGAKCSWIEVTGTLDTSTSFRAVHNCRTPTNGEDNGDKISLFGMLLHDLENVGTGSMYGIFTNQGTDGVSTPELRYIYANNLIYNLSAGGIADGFFLELTDFNQDIRLYNNTVYNCQDAGYHIGGTRFTGQEGGTYRLYNNIGFSNLTDFEFDSVANVVAVEDNASSDGTADDEGGSGNLVNEVPADWFADLTASSEDLHLLETAPGVDAGHDLCTAGHHGTFPWIDLDIDQRERCVEGDTWDIGADEFLLVITNLPPDKPTLAVDESRETGAAFSSSAFSDPDGDAHDASRWQVDEAGGDFSSPVHDSGWTALNLESYDTGDGVYPSGADYIARVAHRDPSGEFTWSDPVAFTAPALAQLSSVEGLFFGQSGGNNLWQFGGAHLDLSSPITCRMRTAPVGPGGVGGEALFHNLYLALEWQSEGTVEVIPIVDGDRRTDLSRTINLAQKAEPTRDRFEIPLVYGFEDGGVEVLRQALRGTWFQAELLVTLSRPSVHGIMVEGVELEQELVRESHPAVSYTIESLDDVDHEQAVPWYVGAGGELLEGDTGVTDDGAGITARIQTHEVAPAGPGGEAAFHNVYLALTRSNPLDATLTLTPIVDGVDQNARNLTLAGVAGPLTEVLEVPLTQGFDVGGVEELRHALRGAFFSLRLEAGVPDGALVFEGLELETEIVREGEAAVAG